MKNYKYTGDQPHNSTIRVGPDGKKENQDLRLYKDAEVELPEDHPVIQGMVTAGLLVEVAKNLSNLKNQK